MKFVKAQEGDTDHDLHLSFGISWTDEILEPGSDPKTQFIVHIRNVLSRPPNVKGKYSQNPSVPKCFSCPWANVFSDRHTNEILARARAPTYTSNSRALIYCLLEGKDCCGFALFGSLGKLKER